MTSILTYLKSDKKFTLYCHDKKIMHKVKDCFVRRYRKHRME